MDLWKKQQNGRRLLTFDALKSNCSFAYLIQSAVLQELSLAEVCYKPEGENTSNLVTSLPSTFAQWIAQQAPFRHSLQVLSLSDMTKDHFPSRHYRCLASLLQLKSLSLHSVEYEAADIEYLLDHAPASLHKISLSECKDSICSFGVRLLTQNKYEEVTTVYRAQQRALQKRWGHIETTQYQQLKAANMTANKVLFKTNCAT